MINNIQFHMSARKLCSTSHTRPEKFASWPNWCPKPLFDFSVHALWTYAKEPHKAQDLGKGNKEQMVGLILKSDPRNMHLILKASVNHLIFTRQGNKRRYASWIRRKSEHNWAPLYITVQTPVCSFSMIALQNVVRAWHVTSATTCDTDRTEQLQTTSDSPCFARCPTPQNRKRCSTRRQHP